MKKACIALFVILALAVSVPGFSFDLNLKKKGCEKACETTYDKCMSSAKEEFEKNKDSAKKLAQETSCKAAKEECSKKCK